MNKLVSVVVPIYNVQPYIRKCIDSLLRQTHHAIEIILVDDASPDDCPKICDEYAAKDNRVRVIHKENGGLSDARNVGIAASAGEYIAFVDGDDFVADDYIFELLKTCQDTGADISAAGFYKTYGKENVPVLKGVELKEFTNLEAIQDIFTANSVCEVMTWNKLYRRSLFIEHTITFPTGRLHEDNFTTYKLFYFANKITYIDKPLYHYIQRSDSIMGREFNVRRLDILMVPDEVERFFGQHRVAMSQAIQSMRVLTALGVYNTYLTSSKRDKATNNAIKAAIREIGDVRGNQLMSPKQKVLVGLARYGSPLYAQLRRLYERKNKKVVG